MTLNTDAAALRNCCSSLPGPLPKGWTSSSTLVIKEFLLDEKPICSSAPFLRMQEFVYEGMANGEVRTMQPIHAAAIVYGAAIRMISLRLGGVLDDPLDVHFLEFWTNTWRALRP